MKLWEYVGKTIKVTCTENIIIQGKCDIYTQALDNEPEIASITVDSPDGNYYELYENEIENIEILE